MTVGLEISSFSRGIFNMIYVFLLKLFLTEGTVSFFSLLAI